MAIGAQNLAIRPLPKLVKTAREPKMTAHHNQRPRPFLSQCLVKPAWLYL